ncbi:zinc-dependent metalloprotease, partial [Pedobacter sp. UBA5917]|uniref:zinc-dependent metalloprotease n=1 Tax=Pedobacter sp. UBA5917 TaxID=1947061 RepID=UPI0025FB2910
AVKQREAMAFFDQQLFTTPTWLLDKNILDNTGRDPIYVITLLQVPVINQILSNATLNKLITAEAIDGADAYKITDLMADLNASVFSELKTNTAVDVYRRNLQKNYLARLIAIVSGPGANASNNDVSSVVKSELKALAVSIKKAGSNANGQTKAHLDDLADRIDTALKAKE